MSDNDDIISGFSGNDGQMPFAVDFSKATRLDRAGTTCDTFECTVQHRHLFVKRLKAEYRDIPLYRAAFEKEYELGVGLNHVSLPRYVGFGEDYIVMDYIEGDTLADLIRHDDPRLASRRFVRKLLGELIDVVEYLHNRHVVHCDIKPDNIIISPYGDRPLTLIDLDKAYTSWLETTHGNTVKYGCTECADGLIDFKGIGLIASKLGMKRFATTCDNADVTAESLRKGLDRGRIVRKILIWSLPFAAVAVIVVMAMQGHLKDFEDSPTSPPVDATEIDKSSASLNVTADTVTDANKTEDSAAPPLVIVPVTDNVAAVKNTDKTDASAPGIATDTDNVDDIVKKHYGMLYKRHDYLRALAADTATSSNLLLLVIQSYSDDQMAAQRRIISEVMARYGLTEPLEAHAILGTSEEWGRFMREDADINKLYCREIDSRSAK